MIYSIIILDKILATASSCYIFKYIIYVCETYFNFYVVGFRFLKKSNMYFKTRLKRIESKTAQNASATFNSKKPFKTFKIGCQFYKNTLIRFDIILLTCPDMSYCLWYNLIRFCSMFRHVIMLLMQFDTFLKLCFIQTCCNTYDAIWYESQTCPDMS